MSLVRDRGSDTSQGNTGAPVEVAEGVKGVLSEGAAMTETRRWQHKVEMWKHPKARPSTDPFTSLLHRSAFLQLCVLHQTDASIGC